MEDVAGFVAWLRLPPAGRDGKVAVLPTVQSHCSAASVNRKLAALTSFCEFHARHGVSLARLLTTMQPNAADLVVGGGVKRTKLLVGRFSATIAVCSGSFVACLWCHRVAC